MSAQDPAVAPLSVEVARDLARLRHNERWRPVPGYAAPEDHVNNSYAPERHDGGWVFRPTTMGLDQNRMLAKDSVFYVVRDDGFVHVVAYEHGMENAIAVLAGH